VFPVEVSELKELLLSKTAVEGFQFQTHPDPNGRNVPVVMQFPLFQKKPTGQALLKNRNNRQNFSPQILYSWDQEAEIHVQFPGQTAGAIHAAAARAFCLIELELAEEKENRAVREDQAIGQNTTIFSTP